MVKNAVSDTNFTKEDMSDILNDILETDIQFAKMSQKDLQKLFVTLLENPIEISRKLIAGKAKSRLAEVGELIDKVQNEGLLGLGILKKAKQFAGRDKPSN